MAQVRAVLGEDAIIVATREEDGGVRVTAALEDDSQLPGTGNRRPAVAANVTPSFEEPEEDIFDVVGDALHRHGVPGPIADRLLDAMEGLDLDSPVVALGAALDAVFHFSPLPQKEIRRPLMLVGPPGAGKTLSIAKLAARAAFNKQSVGVVTTDTVRAGGVEQLSAFTRLLRVKLVTVEDPVALADALLVNRDMEQILIDTSGRNPFDPEDIAELKAMIASVEADPVLVLPAGIDALEAAEIGTIFRKLGSRRILVTRLDTTRRLGSVLAAVYESGLIFSDVSATPHVADGLSALNPMVLARLILPDREPSQRMRRQTGTHA